MTKLAIVIPYYKPTFFKDALLSIKKQTNSNFHLYIGDDDSPHDPRAVIKEVFGDTPAVTYKKFESNLGGQQLTKQWERCIDMSSEPFIWLFSDDDIMPADSVERFYGFINTEPKATLMRFNLEVIDDMGQKREATTQHPLHETGTAFMYRRLQSLCLSAACEYIFSRETYIQNNGFANFPVAWAADDATWIKFGESAGIYTIPGAPVSWRVGNFNLSASNKNIAMKTKASIMFVNFVRDHGCTDKSIQFGWLIAQLNVMRYTPLMKAKFVIELMVSGMFSFADMLTFVSRRIVNRNIHIK